jgi:hypothetical protein
MGVMVSYMSSFNTFVFIVKERNHEKTWFASGDDGESHLHFFPGCNDNK